VKGLNGVDMGRILHSANACINTVNHIGNERERNMLVMEHTHIPLQVYINHPENKT
jgi:hypothetical protein